MVDLKKSRKDKFFGYRTGRFEMKKGTVKIMEAIQSIEKEKYSRSFLRHMKIKKKRIAAKNMPPVERM